MLIITSIRLSNRSMKMTSSSPLPNNHRQHADHRRTSSSALKGNGGEISLREHDLAITEEIVEVLAQGFDEWRDARELVLEILPDIVRGGFADCGIG